MPRYVNTRNTFLGGELSRRADGRSDLAQYQQGCKQLRNFVVMPNGGVTKRPGSRFALDIVGSTGKTMLGSRAFPFVYSNDEVYIVIIWTANDGGVHYRIVNSESLADATVTVDGNVSQNCVTETVYEPNGENILFTLDGLQYVQSADVMTFCGAGVRPFCVFRTARKDGATEAVFHVADYLDGSAFGANDTEVIQRMPFRDENVTATTMTPSSTTGTITITSSVAFFKPSHVGAYMRITHGSSPPVAGYAKITTFTSTTVVSATTLNNFGANSASSVWAESAWSPRWGFPRSVTYYNQRLVFGGTHFQGDTFWLSQVSDYFQFEPIGSGLDDAMNYTLSPDNGRVNLIQWMVGGKKLTIGTIAEEHVGVVEASGTDLNVQFSAETAHGSAYIQPRRIAYAVPFIQNSSHRVRELVFNFQSDSYVANDLTLLRDDIAEGTYDTSYAENKIRQVAWQEAPFSIFWMIDDAGNLYGITRDRQQQVAAWHSHAIGGKVSEINLTGNAGPDHHALVRSICCTPSPTNDGDRLWMTVMREINGSVCFYLEFLDRYRDFTKMEFIGSNPDNFFYFLDCAKGANSGSPTNAWTGFTHLKGQTVTVMADSKLSSQSVLIDSSGNFTLPNGQTASNVVVGIPYKARVKTARTEGGSPIGSSTGSIRRPDQIRMNIFKSRFFKFGFESQLTTKQEVEGTVSATQVDAHDQFLEDYIFNDPSEIPNDPYYPESGIITRPAPANYDDKAIAVVLSELPYPCTVLGISVRAVESDV